MAVYYGVVHNNRVELSADAHLPNGARVEVRPQVSGAADHKERPD